jgi:integrase
MSETPQTPKWVPTSVQHMYRNRDSGRYYSRAYVQGKEVWRSLKTDVFTVAKLRLSKELAAAGRSKRTAAALTGGTGEIRHAIAEYQRQLEDNVESKPASIHYRKQLVAVIKKTWPDLEKDKLSGISDAQCQTWAAKLAKSYSPTRYNNTVDTLRQIFEICIKFGLAVHNPALAIQKVTPRPKHLVLPSESDFKRIVQEIRDAEGALSMGCADMVEFLTYSGCRLQEAGKVRWADINEDQGYIRILETKSGKPRNVPLLPAMRDLLARMQAKPRGVRNKLRLAEDRVLAVAECEKSLTAACTRVGATRITHHDLRHLFATRCIEAGIDIPTVSRWLGHQDGGVLAMKTYGHLRDEHSQRMAEKVKF